MKEYRGGNIVKKGVYLNKTNGELTQLYSKVRVLPGTDAEKYIRVPGALAVMAGPFAGLALVIFLPLVGIIGMIGFAAYKAWQGLEKVFQPAAMVPEPGVAHLTQKGGTAVKGEQATEEGLEQITKEVAERREQGEK